MTVELDADTAGRLQHLAQAWGVSATEAVKQAVQTADASVAQASSQTRVEAFRHLQRVMQLTPEQAAAWKAGIRDARR